MPVVTDEMVVIGFFVVAFLQFFLFFGGPAWIASQWRNFTFRPRAK